MKYTVKKISSVLLSIITMVFCIPAVYSQAEQETYIDGDVNADGVFNIADVVMMNQWLLGIGNLVNSEAGDVCKDNIIDVFDMCIMKRMLLEKIGFQASIKNVQWNANRRVVRHQFLL